MINSKYLQLVDTNIKIYYKSMSVIKKIKEKIRNSKYIKIYFQSQKNYKSTKNTWSLGLNKYKILKNPKLNMFKMTTILYII